MNGEQPQCKRSDLAAYLLRSEDYGVKDDGTADLANFLGETEVGADEADEYHCLCCLEYWPVEDRYHAECRQEAWQAALGHLKVKEVV